MGYFYIFSFLVTYGNIFATIKEALILNSIELKVNGVYYKIIEFTQVVSFPILNSLSPGVPSLSHTLESPGNFKKYKDTDSVGPGCDLGLAVLKAS